MSGWDMRDASRRMRARPVTVSARLGEGLLSQVLNVITEGLLILDLGRGRLVDVNQSFESMVGWPREALLGKSGDELGLWVRRRDRVVLVRQLLADGAVDRFETLMRTASRGVLDVEVTAQLIQINEEDFVLATVRDVTDRRGLEEGLRRSSEAVAKIFDHMPTAFFAVDQDWRMTFVNPIAATIMRKRVADVLGKNLWEEFPEAVGTPFYDAGLKAMIDQAQVDLEAYYESFDSWFEVHAFPKGNGLSVYFTDISDRKRAEQALRTSAARTSAILEAALDCIISIDAKGHIIEFNPAAERTFGYRREDALGKPMAELIIPPSTRDQHLRGMARYLETGRGSILDRRQELTAMRADGTLFPAELSVTRVDVPGPPIFSGHVRDITDRKRNEQEIAFLAFHDQLTRLPNRVRFEEVLEAALARARRGHLSLAVLYLDVDNFKLVNDGLGHAAGDELLQQMAGRLLDERRETDMLARQGGDEFMVLLPDIADPAPPGELGSSQVGTLVAERLHEALRRPFSIEGTEVSATVSIGIATYPTGGEDAVSILRSADAAMYQSKRSRRGSHAVYAGNGLYGPAELSFGMRLRHAAENEEWELHYQPMMNLERAEVIGVEALVRWTDGGNMILPSAFIPLAEEFGLIHAIGKWVRAEVERQVGTWKAMGLTPTIAFNLSLPELHADGLADEVAAFLARAQIAPDVLVIEITESAAMSDPERSGSALHALHDLGVRIAIDDFGTGYSSLTRLSQLPVDILKIDRSFVRYVPDDPRAASIVTAIVALAKTLGAEPMAEGIETPDQHAFILELGCRLGQGFLFAQPMPAAEVTELLARAATR
jgi:diguanylate cyclase (GGDEF)-like protein/PAS domain S-box-containing protein